MSDRLSRYRLRWSYAVLGWLALAAVAGPPVRGDESELENRRSPIVVAVERARPSIVSIFGEKTVTADGHTAEGEVGRRVNGMGTGVVIDQRGYIVTNYHVVEGVKKISVTTDRRETFVATLVANDPKTDLAVIKIDAGRDLPVIDIGTSADLMPGETVIAVGNAYGYHHTVTRGIISALNRTVQVSDAQSYEDLIQTDASINPGNSGGPLMNINGKMIGVNVAVRAGAQGIGFAIPTDKVTTIAATLLTTKRIDHTWHGLVARPDDDEQGVSIATVDEASPAAESGVQSDDVITSIGGEQVDRALDLEKALLGHRPGDEIDIEVRRGDEPIKLSMVLGKAPTEPEETVDPIWDMLGLELQPVPSRQFQQQHGTRYRGGLRVADVRATGPAARQGIRRGDVLVGLHIYETITLDNVKYILNDPEMRTLGPLKFYVLRPNQPVVLYGHVTLAKQRR